MARRIVIFSVILGLLGAGGLWWWSLIGKESTDNAYIKADILPIMSRVNGTLNQILVADNQYVKQGQPLFQLDDRDFRNAVQQAQATLARQQAALDHLTAREQAQQAQVAAAQANVTAAQASAERTLQQLNRLSRLSSQQYVSADDLDAAKLNRTAALAKVAQAQAQLQAEQANLAVITDEQPQLQAAVAMAQSEWELAQLQLSYTQIRAPRAGQVTHRQVQLGQTVAPGNRLVSLVTDSIWVEANYKETQVEHMQIGQAVEVVADALPGKVFRGHIGSFSGATGSEFALLPPQNATGNFTKVVQRLPVRLQFDEDEQTLAALRPGMSVIATVHTAAQ